MEVEAKDIAAAANAETDANTADNTSATTPIAVAEKSVAVAEKPVASPKKVAVPETVAVKPKGKPGRPRKVAAPATAPVKVAKAKKAVKAAAIVPALPVAAAKPALRKPATKLTKAAPAKATEIVIKTQKSVTASPRIAAPKQKDFLKMTTIPTEVTETIQTAMKDAAGKAKAALEKSQAALGDMGAFTKGNMEAVVESSKILATGLQEMSKSYVAESKSVVETMTAEIKDLASVKSPTEFFEKQSAMMRKQFDAAVAVSSKNSEAMLKLASEAFQPISNRVSLAVEKIKQAA